MDGTSGSAIASTRSRALVVVGTILVFTLLPSFAAAARHAVRALGETSRQPLVVTDTAYPIPDGALFVATTGNDATNDGSEAAPYRTVTKAVAVAAAGATIVIREGTYREAVPVFWRSSRSSPTPVSRCG